MRYPTRAAAVAVVLLSSCPGGAGEAPRSAMPAARPEPASAGELDSGPGPREPERTVEPGPPVIGLTGYVIEPGTRGDTGFGRYQVTRTYVQALVRAGAIPIHLVPVDDELVPAVLDGVDGLVLCGGPDIDPAVYGEERHPSVELLPPERQAFDLALAREASRRGLPTLGICLGAQELNVARGGTMVQDIPSEVPSEIDHRQVSFAAMSRAVHEVGIVDGTRLAAIYGPGPIRVNSAHHQACDDMGEGLRIAARAPDGVIEGFDDPSHPFLVGVQFHPEVQTDPPGLHDPLFRALVEAASAHRPRRLARPRSADRAPAPVTSTGAASRASGSSSSRRAP